MHGLSLRAGVSSVCVIAVVVACHVDVVGQCWRDCTEVAWRGHYNAQTQIATCTHYPDFYQAERLWSQAPHGGEVNCLPGGGIHKQICHSCPATCVPLANFVPQQTGAGGCNSTKIEIEYCECYHNSWSPN